MERRISCYSWHRSCRSIIATFVALQLIAAICVDGQIKDYKLAHSIAREIRYEQTDMSIEQLISKLTKIKEAVRGLITQDIPWRLSAEMDRALLINSLALVRLIEVSSDKCYLQSSDLRQGNVHKLNYIELENVARLSFPAKNIQTLIDKYYDAQLFICRQGLALHFRMVWSRITDLHPYAIKFKRLLIDEFPINKQLNEFTAKQKTSKILNFMKLNHDFVDDDPYATENEKIIRAYNATFKTSCKTFILQPFHTVMATFNKINRDRPNIMRHNADLVRLYDICEQTPETVEDVASIGQFVKIVKKATKPADAANRGAGDAINLTYPNDDETRKLAREKRQKIMRLRHTFTEPHILETSKPNEESERQNQPEQTINTSEIQRNPIVFDEKIRNAKFEKTLKAITADKEATTLARHERLIKLKKKRADQLEAQEAIIRLKPPLIPNISRLLKAPSDMTREEYAKYAREKRKLIMHGPKSMVNNEPIHVTNSQEMAYLPAAYMPETSIQKLYQFDPVRDAELAIERNEETKEAREKRRLKMKHHFTHSKS